MPIYSSALKSPHDDNRTWSACSLKECVYSKMYCMATYGRLSPRPEPSAPRVSVRPQNPSLSWALFINGAQTVPGATVLSLWVWVVLYVSSPPSLGRENARECISPHPPPPSPNVVTSPPSASPGPLKPQSAEPLQDWETGPRQVTPLFLGGAEGETDAVLQTMTSLNRSEHLRFVLPNCTVCPYMFSSLCCCLCRANLLLTYLVLWQPRSGDYILRFPWLLFFECIANEGRCPSTHATPSS